MDFLRKVTDAVERLQAHGLAAPHHVTIRAAVLLGDENIVYLDSDLGRTSDDSGIGGEIHIFTSSRVVLLRLQPSSRRAAGAAVSTVEAYTWSRAILESIQMVGGDDVWGGVSDERVPRGTGYQLTYRNGETINVPIDPDDSMKPHKEQALHFLPSLLDDLVPGPTNTRGPGRF